MCWGRSNLRSYFVVCDFIYFLIILNMLLGLLLRDEQIRKSADYWVIIVTKRPINQSLLIIFKTKRKITRCPMMKLKNNVVYANHRKCHFDDLHARMNTDVAPNITWNQGSRKLSTSCFTYFWVLRLCSPRSCSNSVYLSV